MKTSISKLWKSEDWLAVWIGFILIFVAGLSVLSDTFDFTAAKFSTWHLWEDVAEKKSLLAQLSGPFWIKMIRTFAVLGTLFTAGVKLQGGKIREYLPAFAVLFILAVGVRLISAEFTLNRYLEWAFWALIIGLLISNTVGVPNWLRPAIRTEFYIKTGLVVMGFSVLFSNIAKFGLYGLGIEKRFTAPKDAIVHTVAPTKSLGSMLDFDTESCRENFNLGYFDAKRTLYGLYGKKYYIDRTMTEMEAYNLLLKHLRPEGASLRQLNEDVLPRFAKRVDCEGDYYDLFIVMMERLAKTCSLTPFRIRTDREFYDEVMALRTDDIPDKPDKILDLFLIEE